jgi:hypothetical protein
LDRAVAKKEQTVDLPTPPFAEAIAIVFFIVII